MTTRSKTNFPFIVGKVSEFADLFFRIGTPVVLLFIYLLGSKFATKDELDEAKERTTKIETTIAVMVEQARINDIQDKFIADHENRIRSLEMAKN